MTWFKVDDTLAFHGKTVAAGNAAVGMWVRAGAWSAQTLTDGFVPDHMVLAFGGAKLARLLVSSGMWDEAQGGYRFHDWGDYQPSRVSVESDRKASRERQQRGRERARAKREAEQSQRDKEEASRERHAVTDGVTRAVVTGVPTRPDPTRPVLPSEVGKERSGARKRGTRISVDWMPDPDVKAKMLAERPGVDYRSEHQNFIDHFLAASGQNATKVDWNAAWRKWMRSARTGLAQPRMSGTVSADRSYFTPPAPPEGMPSRLLKEWNLAWSRANREGQPGPDDWRDLEAS